MGVEENIKVETLWQSNGLMRRMSTLATNKWVGKVGAAFVDQAFFAGSNFVINVLLARWMLPDEYGAFVVVYAWFLIIQNLYDAVLIEPMMVYGAGKFSSIFRKYLGFVYAGHVILSLVGSLALFLGALFAWSYDTPLVAGAMMGVVVASPFILTRWLTRQPFYVISRPQIAVIGGVIYLIVTMIVLVTLQLIPSGYPLIAPMFLAESDFSSVFWYHRASYITPSSALLAMALGGLCGSIVLTSILKPIFRLRNTEELNTKDVVKDHWKYGRWSSIDRMLAWVPSNIFYVMLPILVGLSASGALRAIINLVMPINMAMLALIAIMLPSFVRAYNINGRPALVKRMIKISIALVSFNGMYCLFITVFGQQIIHFVFDGKYDDVTTIPVLFTMGLVPVLVATNTVLDTGLRSMGQVRTSFFSKIIPTIITLTLGLYLTAEYGILGVNVSLIITNIVTSMILFYLYRRPIKEKPPLDNAPIEI